MASRKRQVLNFIYKRTLEASEMVRVTAAIIVNSGKIFIAKRKPPGRMPGMWEFPGGKIEEGESPEQCLRRELHEEFGIDAAVGRHVGTSIYQYEFYTVELMAYRTRIIAGEITLNDHSDMAWVVPGDLSGYEFAPADLPFVEKIIDGRIKLTKN
jgi:8-oxo-dGTP diphosphatase